MLEEREVLLERLGERKVNSKRVGDNDLWGWGKSQIRFDDFLWRLEKMKRVGVQFENQTA